MQKITPCLWFDTQAEEAAKFYVSIFHNAKLGKVTHYGKEGFEIHGRPEGSVMTVEFELNGQPFLGLNGGPAFTFSEAISFQVPCETQADIDYYWDKLGAGGDPEAQQCGWLKDKFGLSWQIVPTVLPKLMDDKNPKKAQAVMRAVLQAKKFDIAALERAYNEA